MEARTTGRGSSTGSWLSTNKPTTNDAFSENAPPADNCLLKGGDAGAGPAGAGPADMFTALRDLANDEVRKRAIGNLPRACVGHSQCTQQMVCNDSWL